MTNRPDIMFNAADLELIHSALNYYTANNHGSHRDPERKFRRQIRAARMIGSIEYALNEGDFPIDEDGTGKSINDWWDELAG